MILHEDFFNHVPKRLHSYLIGHSTSTVTETASLADRYDVTLRLTDSKILSKLTPPQRKPDDRRKNTLTFPLVRKSQSLMGEKLPSRGRDEAPKATSRWNQDPYCQYCKKIGHLQNQCFKRNKDQKDYGRTYPTQMITHSTGDSQKSSEVRLTSPPSKNHLR